MALRNNEYWERRARQRMAEYHRKNDEVIRHIVAAYNRGQQNVLEAVERIFGTYVKNHGLTPEEARRLLSESISRREWERIRDQYRKAKDPEVRRRLLAILNAPAYAARITKRLALQADMLIQSKLIADAELELLTRGLMNTINEAYYRTLFDIQKGVGYAFEFAAMPRRTVEAILKRPWSGEHFSKRIWGNTDVLARTLTEVITGGLMSGASIRQMRKQIEERFDVAKHAANRLLRTETTYMANAAEMEAYEEAEIERYRFVATLDLRTSEKCRQHDGKVYLVKDARPGVNMPPLHPYCRSTTVAVIDVGEDYNLQRRARDPVTGKTYLVPADMSYAEWRKSVADKCGQQRIEVMEKQIQNKAADKKQYQRIKSIIGSDAPKSLSVFQEVKYNKANEWAAMKRQVKTFRKINSGPYSAAYKTRLKETYRYFRRDGSEFTIHALNRVLGQKTGKGKRPFTLEEVKTLLAKPPNYRQPDGKLVRYENGLAIIQASDTGEIVSVVTMPKPKSEWEEVS